MRPTLSCLGTVLVLLLIHSLHTSSTPTATDNDLSDIANPPIQPLAARKNSNANIPAIAPHPPDPPPQGVQVGSSSANDITFYRGTDQSGPAVRLHKVPYGIQYITGFTQSYCLSRDLLYSEQVDFFIAAGITATLGAIVSTSTWSGQWKAKIKRAAADDDDDGVLDEEEGEEEEAVFPTTTQNHASGGGSGLDSRDAGQPYDPAAQAVKAAEAALPSYPCAVIPGNDNTTGNGWFDSAPAGQKMGCYSLAHPVQCFMLWKHE